MLGTSKYGWVNIYIGEKPIGCTSYLTDVPFDLLDSMIQYLSDDNQLNYSVEFDAEGYHFGLIEISEDLYIYDTAVMEEDKINLTRIDPEDLGLESYASAKDIVYLLAREVISDIKTNFKDWLYWMDGPDTMTLTYKKARKKDLNERLKKLEKLIKDNK